MAKLFKNSKKIFAVVMAFAVLAVSLFAGGIVASAEEGADPACKGTRVEYWDGTQSGNFTTGDGSVTNPYIIENAKQLNYVCTVADTATEGKYYKVDPEIKAFILQPQAVVSALGGDSAFIDIASAAETKELFEVTAAGQSLKNWLANGVNKVFAGNFDGSGVAIYGLYADDALKGTQQCGLFPILDGNDKQAADGGLTSNPTVIKNFALKNSYFKGLRRLGAISSTSWYAAGGTKVNGFVNASYIEVANCFIIGQDRKDTDNTMHGWNSANPNAEMGVAFGSMGNDPIKADHLSVYGNDTEYRVYGSSTATTYTVDGAKKFNRVFSDNYANNDGTQCGEIHNSIALDALISGMKNNTDKVTYCTNVYTNVTSTVKDVVCLENNGYGPEGQAAMETLDWETDWFMGQYGPTFRSFHGEISLVQTAKTHCYACKECGFMSYGGEEEHIYDVEDETGDYICTVCEYQCLHTNQSVNESYEGDCVTPAGVFYHCNDCGRDYVEDIGIPPTGHTLEWVDEIYADCENTGRQGYWHCTVCGSNFTGTEAEALMAKMETSIDDPDTALLIPIAPHNATNREDGSVRVFSDESGHWWLCYTCDGRLEAIEDEDYAEEGKVKKHKFEDSVCVECGWECTEHDYKETGKVLVAGDCETDREEELKCTICGDKKSVVTKPAGHTIEKVAKVEATDKLEGLKEHYVCTGCKEIYLDAEGKTKAVEAELIIPKVLPAGYQNVVIGGSSNGNVNTDTGNKSPATGDSVASVLAVAALAGVALVFARKK